MFALPTPLLALAVAAGCAIGGFFVGADWEQKAQSERENERLRETFKAYTSLVEKYNGKSQELEDAKKSRTVIYRDIEKDADRVLSRPANNVACIDADGLRVANEALTGTRETRPTGVTDAAMPPADRTGRGDR